MAADALIEQDLALGLLMIGAGILVAAFPGPLAQLNETFDAVGSTRTDVEPTRWRLHLVRIVGLGLTIAGGWFLVTAYNLGP